MKHIRVFFKFRSMLSALLLWSVVHSLALAATHEFSIAANQGGTSSGHCILIISSRDSSRSYPTSIENTAYEKGTSRTFSFPSQTVTIPAAGRNPATGEIMRAGAQMVNYKLRDAGFNQLGRLVLRVNTEGSAPLFSVIVLLTDDHGNVLVTADLRQARVVP